MALHLSDCSGGSGGADLPWSQSYEAGYTDANGQYCGGSEVMHIKAHGGKLFAFNGYWEDARYTPSVVPFNSSSAQVLRLDEPNGTWTVDLDTGSAGVAHMKGNIMHSVEFGTDSQGRLLPEKISQLVAASFAGQGQPNATPAISVWVRDDRSGKWAMTDLLPGTQGGRRVPRDIEIHRDAVTGVDRIFLLCGDSGVISGAYSAESKAIEWDHAPEFPVGSPAKTFSVRALGMAVANGRLYFSVGGQLFVRTDGTSPSWTLAWQIPGQVNTEVGGIRGLTAVPSPASSGRSAASHKQVLNESLLLVWTPNGRSIGEIYRLDEEKSKTAVKLHNSTEETLQHLYDVHSAAVGAGLGTARSSLGGYNKMFAFQNPATRELMHLIGFEQALNDDASQKLQFNGYYAGGCVAVRSRDQAGAAYSYKTIEVNGLYSPGKPMLEAPRAFALSPFPGEESVIYFGGFDANFHDSTNKAWIFKAGINAVLQ